MSGEREGEDIQPERQKLFTKSQCLQILEEHNYKVNKAADAKVKEMCHFDVTNEDAMMVEDRVEAKILANIGKPKILAKSFTKSKQISKHESSERNQQC